MENLKKKSAAVMAGLCVCAAAISLGSYSVNAYAVEIDLSGGPIEVAGERIYEIYLDENDKVSDDVGSSVSQVSAEHVRKDISGMSSDGIVDELLYYEDDELTKDMVKQSTAVLTGEKEIQGKTSDGFLMVASCDAGLAQNIMPNWRLLGRSETYLAKTNDKLYNVIESNTLTQNDVKENREMLELLYNTVWDVVEATEGMTDREKITYYTTWIRENLETALPVPDAPGYVLYIGETDCGGKANLLYLFGINSGLDVNVVMGQYLDASHAWNEVKIDGEWYYIDLFAIPYLQTKESMLKLGYIFTPAAPTMVTAANGIVTD